MWYPLCSSDDRVDSALAKELEAAVKAEPASTPPTAMEAGAAALAAAGGREVSSRALSVRGLEGRRAEGRGSRVRDWLRTGTAHGQVAGYMVLKTST